VACLWNWKCIKKAFYKVDNVRKSNKWQDACKKLPSAGCIDAWVLLFFTSNLVFSFFSKLIFQNSSRSDQHQSVGHLSLLQHKMHSLTTSFKIKELFSNLEV